MGEFWFEIFLRKALLAIGIIGVLVGLDFIFGAKVSLVLRRFLDRMVDVDKKVLSNPKRVRLLGTIILIISLIIVFLIIKI